MCNKQLDHKITWDIRYAFKRFPNGNFKNKNNFDLFDPENNKLYCIGCGTSYYKFKFLKYKVSNLQNRQITGKLKLNDIPIDKLSKSEYCVICNKLIKGVTQDTNIYLKNYVEGIGTMCHECYFKFT